METNIAMETGISSAGKQAGITKRHTNNTNNNADPADVEFKNTKQTRYNSIATNGKSKQRKSPRSSQVENIQQADKSEVNVCRMYDDDNVLSRMPCYRKLHKKFGCKVFLFLLMSVLDVADLVSDWLLYRDVTLTETGLVYGPPEDSLKYALLAFSVIGSLTFVFEVVNLWWEIFRDNPWVDSDLLSAITVWIEDVPQIVINVFIAACREDAISYFQLVKASVVIAGCIIRIIVTLVKYCGKRARCELENASKNTESCRHVTYRVFIMLGLIAIFAGSITVFLFTQSERNPDGKLTFHVPHNLVKGTYDDQRYFQNVSIYFSHPLFDYSHTGRIAEGDVNWIRMVTINDIRNHDIDVLFKLEYDTATKSQVVLSLSDNTGTLQVTECLDINRASRALTIVTSCTTAHITTTRSEFIFKFHFVEAKMPGLVFGDIKFNMKFNEAGKCVVPASEIYETVVDRIQDSASEVNAAVHYFRTKAGVSETATVIHQSGNKGEFYHADDLIPVEEVWETGFAYCKSSGSLAPHRDLDIDVQCT